MGANGLRQLNKDEEEKFSDQLRLRKNEAVKKSKSKKKRLYDPDLKITFLDFCKIMGFEIPLEESFSSALMPIEFEA